MPTGNPTDWLMRLDDEDLAFIKRFALNSGSLKAMAQNYGVSYPTVRLRLDRLIQKIQIFDEHDGSSAFEQLARARAAEGKISTAMLKELLAAHREEIETHKDNSQ